MATTAAKEVHTQLVNEGIKACLCGYDFNYWLGNDTVLPEATYSSPECPEWACNYNGTITCGADNLPQKADATYIAHRPLPEKMLRHTDILTA